MEGSDSKISGIKKIAIVGPESTGKSTLTEFLADHYKTLWVHEVARDYLTQINRPYVKEDLNVIAKKQIELEDSICKKANNLLFCDTNLTVIKVWSEHKYGYCEAWILKEIMTRKYDLTLLADIDIPWIEDPQREHPHMRKYFYSVYYQELKSQKVLFYEISGNIQNRMKQAISAVNTLF